MTVLVGLDLSWTGRHRSGICVLRVQSSGDIGLERLDCEVMSADEAAAFLESLGASVIAAIDAPLVVGPGRHAEAMMARAYQGTGLHAYSARVPFLEAHGITAGPELGSRLSGSGWNLDPAALVPAAPGRWALEVFPHSVIVSLLGAPSIIRYKKGPRTGRLAGFARYQGLLQEWCRANLGDACLEGLASVLRIPATTLSGAALKSHEDRLDAISCAVAALVAWREGREGLRVFGDATDGYIAVPVTSGPAPTSPSAPAPVPARSSPPARAAGVPASAPHRR